MILTLENKDKVYRKVNQNGSYIRFIQDPPQNLIDIALKDYNGLKYVPHSIENILLSVSYNYYTIRHVKNMYFSYDEIIQILKTDPRCYQYIHKIVMQYNYQTEELINLILDEGDNIRFIENPTVEYMEHAIKNIASSIRYIKNPSEALINLAIDYSNSWLFWFKDIKNPTQEMLNKALKKDSSIIQYIKNPSEELINYVLSIKGTSIKWIKKPSFKHLTKAIDTDFSSIEVIKDKNISIELLQYYKDNSKGIMYVPAMIYKYKYLRYLKSNSSVDTVYNILIKNYDVLYKKYKNPIIKNLFSKIDKVSFNLAINLAKNEINRTHSKNKK
jgi:hypothetical protein